MNRPVHRLIRAIKTLLDELEYVIEGRTGERHPGPPAMGGIIFRPPEGAPKMGMISVEPGSADLAATVTYLDADGNPTEGQGTPVWASDDETVATVQESADDPHSATVSIVNTGAAIISVTLDQGDVDPLVSQGTVTVIANKAVTGDVQFAEVPQVNPL